MKDKTEALLFSLINRAVFGRALSDEERESVSEEITGRLYALSKKHDVAHLVGYGLEQEGLLPPDNALFSRFQKEQMLAVLRQERLDYELSQIKTVLEEAKIRFLPLKGAVIRPLYPEAWMRTSCDIDVLVDEKNIDACVSILQERLSYETKGMRDYHDISLYAPSGVHLELHFSILEQMEVLDRELCRVWEYASPIGPDAYEHQLTSEYLMFHTVAHMAYHFIRGGCGIRPLIDLRLMAERLTVDRSVLYTHLAVCSLECFYESVLALSSVWFAEGEETDLTRAMQTYLLTGGVYGTAENHIAVEKAKNGTARYLFKRLFLPYEAMTRLYPILKKAPYLLPFCWIARWCAAILGKKRRRVFAEAACASGVSDDTAEQMRMLLERLGL